VGDERAHAELLGQRERLAVVALGVVGAACRRDVTRQAERVDFAGPGSQSTSEHQCLLSVTGRFVNPTSPEGAHPSAQEDELRSVVSLATVELLNRPRNQRQRFGVTGEAVGGAESRGDKWYRAVELPRLAVAETSLENTDRTGEISTSEMSSAKIEQPEVQRDGMVGCLGDLHGCLGVPDGLIKAAELGQHEREVSPRASRFYGRRSGALVAQIRLKGDIVLKKNLRLGELPLGGVRSRQIGRGDHLDRLIAEGARDAQSLLSESDGLVVVASEQALGHQEAGDPRQPMAVIRSPASRASWRGGGLCGARC